LIYERKRERIGKERKRERQDESEKEFGKEKIQYSAYLSRPLTEEYKPKRNESEESVLVHEIAHHVATPLIVPSPMKKKETSKKSCVGEKGKMCCELMREKNRLNKKKRKSR